MKAFSKLFVTTPLFLSENEVFRLGAFEFRGFHLNSDQPLNSRGAYRIQVYPNSEVGHYEFRRPPEFEGSLRIRTASEFRTPLRIQGRGRIRADRAEFGGRRILGGSSRIRRPPPEFRGPYSNSGDPTFPNELLLDKRGFNLQIV